MTTHLHVAFALDVAEDPLPYWQQATAHDRVQVFLFQSASTRQPSLYMQQESQKGDVRIIVSYIHPARMLTHLRLVAMLAQELAELSARALVARRIHFSILD